MPRHHSIPLDIVRNHQIARLRNGSALIDTGSPFTIRPPGIVAEQLGEPVRWLVGNDVLGRDRVLIDWPGKRLVVGGPEIAGETIALEPKMGVFQIAIEGRHGPALAMLDSGAQLSYAPRDAVADLLPIDSRPDFYPVLGEFEVDVYWLRIRVGSREIEGEFGVLPELLGGLLSMIGGSGWILGSDFFRDRAIQLDLGRNRLVDGTIYVS